MTRLGRTIVAAAVVLAGCAGPTVPPSARASAPPASPTGAAPEPSQPPDPTPVPTAGGLTPKDPCTVADLDFTGRDMGAGLGSAAFAVTVTNASSSRCGVAGYPRIALLGRTGGPLPTDWSPATDGAMLFPAVREQIIELEPGDAATFAVGYSDNPFGATANLPYEQACPPSIAVRVFLPGDEGTFGVASVASGPCNGVVTTSPFVRGTEPPRE